jgi:glycosyltransferase involved in cell wall biosynthesis
MGARYFVIPPYQKLPQHMKALIKHFKENHYDIVHSGMNTLSVFSLCAAWIAKVPIRINHNHSTASKGETKRNILKYILRPFAKIFATDYCACSRYAGEWLFGKRAMRKSKVTIFNNAIDLNKFKFDQQVREEVRKELNIEDKFVVGHIGRFCYQKNHEFLIDIFEEVHKRRSNAVLLLVGIGELTDDIKKKVHDKGLADFVIFLGRRTDANRLYQAMDVFVLPSHYEGLPVVGVEAQAVGLPCILSTSMTTETKMTSNAVTIGLDEPAAVWADEILSCTNRVVNRSLAVNEVAAAGFDISKETKKLEMFYNKKIADIG